MSTPERAIEIAVAAHEGQRDKAGAPYVHHPLRVMSRFGTPTERAVAVLHDVVEDTKWTLDDLRREFSEDIVEAVDALTRREPDESYVAFVHRAGANPLARRVKLADIEDNLDLSRIPSPTDADHRRMERYRSARTVLLQMESPEISSDLPGLALRFATEADIPLILELIRKIAEYERLLHEVVADEDILQEALFGPRKGAEVIIADHNGQHAGFALFFHNFSTFLGRPGIYLEDVFVNQELRGKGIGKALLVALARIARDRGCGRMEWSVLDWNEPAIQFYKSLGAFPMDEWTVYRVTGQALDELAD